MPAFRRSENENSDLLVSGVKSSHRDRHAILASRFGPEGEGLLGWSAPLGRALPGRCHEPHVCRTIFRSFSSDQLSISHGKKWGNDVDNWCRNRLQP
jgi:hypothetical protein